MAVISHSIHTNEKTKRKEKDEQPYKLYRGKGMPQNPMDIFWLALQKTWGQTAGGTWETKQIWGTENKLQMQLRFKNGDVGKIIWTLLSVQGEEGLNPKIGMLAGTSMQKLSSIYGSQSLGLSENSTIQLGESLITQENPEESGYTGTLIVDNDKFGVYIQDNVMEKLLEIDISQNGGGKFKILGEKS
ncbi:MAG TPA: hypothetical protein VIY47_02980 [Ignavibacteriaceae bacterium]